MIELKAKRLYGQSIEYGNVNKEDIFNEDGSKTTAYIRWSHILERVYSNGRKKQSNCYSNAILCQEWFIFENFLRWYNENVEEGKEDLSIDTDLLSNGLVKCYGPYTCVMIPRVLNNLLKGMWDNLETIVDGRGSNNLYLKIKGSNVKFGNYISSIELGIDKIYITSYKYYKTLMEYRDQIPTKSWNNIINSKLWMNLVDNIKYVKPIHKNIIDSFWNS